MSAEFRPAPLLQNILHSLHVTVPQIKVKIKRLYKTVCKREFLWLLWVSVASGSRGCWFDSQPGLQDVRADGPGSDGRIRKVQEGQRA